MDFLQDVTIQQAILVFGLFAAFALAGAVFLLVLAAQQIAGIEIPEDADFFETLQMLPITVPLALDLLDLAFDVFSAPISWLILELLGLKALQTITLFEGLIPGTQLIPTMTAAWVVARIMGKNDKASDSRLRRNIRDYQLRAEDERYARLEGGRAEVLQDRYRQQPLLPPSQNDSTQPNRPSQGGRQRRLPGSIVEGEIVGEDTQRRYEDPPPEYFDEWFDEDYP